MKIAIIYYSRHHGNTKKLLDAIASKYEVKLVDAAEIRTLDLEDYDMVGFASGIYYSKFHKSVLHFAEENLPEGKKVFFIFTGGMKSPNFTKSIARVCEARGAEILGEYGCLGFDTFGPLKLIGGIAKGHPDHIEMAQAVAFFEKLIPAEEASNPR